MAKFKVGDKVRILDGKDIENYICCWSYGMEAYVGDILTVCNVIEHNGRVGYDMKEGIIYTFDERALELVEE